VGATTLASHVILTLVWQIIVLNLFQQCRVVHGIAAIAIMMARTLEEKMIQPLI
jgi:hypothetical protein